jgi:hypothetical protein
MRKSFCARFADWLWMKTLFRKDEEWKFFPVVDTAESRTDVQRDREEAQRLLRAVEQP